jgi:hypothetical protein
MPAMQTTFSGFVAVAVGLALAGMAACARVSTEDVAVRAYNLPKPTLIVVHDFTVAASDVALDTGIRSRLLQLERGTPAADEQFRVGQEVARVLAESLVKDIQTLGIPTAPASLAQSVAGPTLSIEGQLLTIDQGNQTRRMLIGFGAGASEVRALVQVYEMTYEGRRLVEDFYTTVKSSRKPGMGPMAGAGAAAGRAAESAAMAGGVGILSARSQSVEGDAKNMAREITKMLAQLFVQQGWITSEQAEQTRNPLWGH